MGIICKFFGRTLILLIIYNTSSVETRKIISELQCRNNKNFTLHPFCLMKDYDKNRPPIVNETAVNVSIVASFDDIIAVNDDDCTITFNLELEMSWIEPRLIIMSESSSWKQSSTDEWYTFLSKASLDSIWKPDLDIPNVRKFDIRGVLDRQGEIGLLENKRIWYAFPVQITLNCPHFEFSAYPFDAQYCEFLVGSYQWDIDKLLYKGNMTYNENLQRPLQYEVSYIKALSFEEGIVGSLNFHYMENGQIEYYNDMYSHFAIKMKFERKIQAFIISTYLPSFLIVLSSWLGFLIGTKSIPGRLTVTVVLLLVLINMR